jgi:hypothetical protein
MFVYVEFKVSWLHDDKSEPTNWMAIIVSEPSKPRCMGSCITYGKPLTLGQMSMKII